MTEETPKPPKARKPAKKKASSARKPAKSTTDRRSVVVGAFACLASVVFGAIAGAFVSSADGVRPSPSRDVLSICHAADRDSQVRIIREFAGKTFASNEEGQKWINDQRAEARTTDWIPYTDALGLAIEAGEALEFASKLEKSQ
jgi:hypothetical protein